MNLALAALAALACAAPAQAQTWKQVLPRHIFAPQDQRGATIASEGVTVTVRPAPPADDEDDANSRASFEDARIAVQFPGQPAYGVPQDQHRSSAYGISVGIGRMARGDAVPVVLIAGYSGGMHCCATLQAISLVDGRPVSTILPAKDGAPVDAFPSDIDGDGVRDIRWQDGSLLYAFTSYAASWPVPRIYNLRGGELVDVSHEPGFTRIYSDLARETLSECRERQGSENAGACAAYAYAMAVQGQAEQGISTAVALATRPSQCAGEFDADLCPYVGFEDKLRRMMRDHGYLP